MHKDIYQFIITNYLIIYNFINSIYNFKQNINVSYIFKLSREKKIFYMLNILLFINIFLYTHITFIILMSVYCINIVYNYHKILM